MTECSVVASCNLQWRYGSGSLGVPYLYATETAIFTQNPHQSHLKEYFNHLKDFTKQKV